MVGPQVVIDTNVLVAGLRSRRGRAYRLLSTVGTGEFEIHISVPLVLEYEEVLRRDRQSFGVSEAAIEALINYLCAVATPHEVFYLWRPFLPDPGDDMVLELAVAAGCQFIVTYNLRDFVGVEQFGLEAVTPAVLLNRIGHAP